MTKHVIQNRIRELRYQHEQMSQQALADAVGCTRQTIIMLEQGRYSPSLSLAFSIARVFSCNIEEVFSMDSQV